jgi:carbon-monoxide dehydrogenase large subunit
MTTTTGARFVGQRVARHEDARFLTGTGRYVDDILVAGTLQVAFARSDVARGRIVSVDVSAAKAMPGVVAVFVAGDLEPLLRDARTNDEVVAPHGAARPFRLFADGDVRCVGEPVAMVVAESRYLAEDAVDAIVVEVEIEDAVVGIDQALVPGAPLVHPDRESNLLSASPPLRDTPELDAVIAAAPVVLTETFRQHRYLTVPMETRGILAHWEPFAEQLTIWSSNQGPHGVRAFFARALGIDDSQVRCILPDVGGAFGLKMNPRPEEIATVLASRTLGRPVKWIQDRRENLVADDHARDDVATVTLAAEEDGTLLAAKVAFIEGAGAFPAAHSSGAGFGAMLFPGPYRLPGFAASAQSVATNTQGRGSYRGPWMFETVIREQMMDLLAARLGIDPLELRRRNVIHGAELPYAMPTGLAYDQITAEETLEQAAEILGYAELREQQQAWRAEGRLVGVGISLFTEPTAMAFAWFSTDAAIVRVGGSGRVDVLLSTANHGQSIETTMAQVVADELDTDFSQIRVLQGDTDATPIGGGTGGSRSTIIPGTAARLAAREIRARMLAIVAHALEASVDDLEVVAGRVQVKGTPEKGMSFGEVSVLAYTQPAALPPGVPLGMEAQVRYAPDGFCTWANACHMCLVEIDPDTGEVEIKRFVVSEDCGVMINPNVVEGQIAGGIVQGIGGVLYERLAYDDAGNPLATTFVDYLLPTATEVPIIEHGHVESFAPTNPGGHKGLGEGGAIGAPPALINAIADALAPLGARVRDQPLGPADIVALIEAAG